MSYQEVWTQHVPWGQRLEDTEYLDQIFAPINLAYLCLFFGVIFFGKLMYAFRFIVGDLMHAKLNKKNRAVARRERRKSRAATRAARQPAGGAGGEAKAEDISLVVADAAKAPATLEPTTAAAAATTRRASTYGPATMALASMEANKNAAFSSLDAQLTEADNPAVAISFTAFLMALCIVVTGPRTPSVRPDLDDDPFMSFFETLLWTVIGVALLGLANVLNDKILLASYLARTSLLSGNIATGVTEAGSFIGSALIIRATLTGDGPPGGFGESIALTLLYFFLGQFALIISALLVQCLTKYDDQKEAKRGNPAAGIKFAGNLISLGFIVSYSITVTSSLAAFGLFFVLGTVVQTAVRIFLDRVVLPGSRSVDDEIGEDANWGVALIEAAVTITVGACLGGFMPSAPCLAPASALVTNPCT